MAEFVRSIQEIRDRARKHIEDGAVTQGYCADRQTVLKLLNEALATEIVCVLRYQNHAEMAHGIHSEAVAAEFAEHAREEMEHADWITKRIGQLNGNPDLNPATLAGRSHSEYVECQDLVEMIRENLVAERIAIESYSEIIRYLGSSDPTSRRLMERILEKEEEHADDLGKLMSRLSAPREVQEPVKRKARNDRSLALLVISGLR